MSRAPSPGWWYDRGAWRLLVDDKLAAVLWWAAGGWRGSVGITPGGKHVDFDGIDVRDDVGARLAAEDRLASISIVA